MTRLRKLLWLAPLLLLAFAWAATHHAIGDAADRNSDPDSPLFRQELDTKLRAMDGIEEPPVAKERPQQQAILFVSEGFSACIGSACIGSGCTASACGGSGCGGSACAGSACPGSVCGGSACAGSVCAGSACGGSLCGGSACGVSGCAGSLCSQSACAGSLCGQSACAGSMCANCPSATQRGGAAAAAAACPLDGDGSFANGAGRIAGLDATVDDEQAVIRWIATNGDAGKWRVYRVAGQQATLVESGVAERDRLIEVVDPEPVRGADYRVEIEDDAGRRLAVPLETSSS